jgi:hypothetical protein
VAAVGLLVAALPSAPAATAAGFAAGAVQATVAEALSSCGGPPSGSGVTQEEWELVCPRQYRVREWVYVH